MQSWLSILILLALGAGFGAFNVFLSQWLGPRVVTPEKQAPYECGVPPVGDARERQSVKFYLVAMVFLLFDIEVAFLYPWAMALRDLGWTGFVQVVTFMVNDGWHECLKPEDAVKLLETIKASGEAGLSGCVHAVEGK